MRLSIVVPAFNEEKLLGACLESVKAAVRACASDGLETELIVCDNNSTDATPRIAEGAGAKVVFERVNQISRARNAGAWAASGDWLLFVDADSRLKPASLRDMLAAARGGKVVGGGSLICFDSVPTLLGRWMVFKWNCISRFFKLAAGSFVFCRADAFKDVRGFSEEVFAAEEIWLSRDLKRWGKGRGLGFVILTAHPHMSSGRKFHLYSTRDFRALIAGFLRSPRESFKSRRIWDLFYDGRR